MTQLAGPWHWRCRVWDLQPGRCAERLVGHEGPIWSMQSDGGRLVASVGDDGTLRVWDLETHRHANRKRNLCT